MVIKLCRTSRFKDKQIAAVLLLGVSTAMASWGHTQAARRNSMNSVMETIREYGRGKQPLPASQEKPNPDPAFAGSDGPHDMVGDYEVQVSPLIAKRDFAQLEKEVQLVRTTKSRLKGGHGSHVSSTTRSVSRVPIMLLRIQIGNTI